MPWRAACSVAHPRCGTRATRKLQTCSKGCRLAALFGLSLCAVGPLRAPAAAAGARWLWCEYADIGYDMAVRMQYLCVDNPTNVGLYDCSRNLATVGLQMRF